MASVFFKKTYVCSRVNCSRVTNATRSKKRQKQNCWERDTVISCVKQFSNHNANLHLSDEWHVNVRFVLGKFVSAGSRCPLLKFAPTLISPGMSRTWIWASKLSHAPSDVSFLYTITWAVYFKMSESTEGEVQTTNLPTSSLFSIQFCKISQSVCNFLIFESYFCKTHQHPAIIWDFLQQLLQENSMNI